MKDVIVVVEYYDRLHGSEHKQPFKAFTDIKKFEEYCHINGIQVLKGAFGSTYSSKEYCYLVHFIELVQ